MRQVWMTKVGPPETLQVRELPDPQPASNEVRVRAKACGVNFADVMARLGLYQDAPPLPTVVGYEVAGVVDALGAQVKGFEIGDSVIALCRFGGYSDTVTVPEGQLYPLPEGWTFPEGAALPVNYLTAYQMLYVMGSVREGDQVLVHSAAGGVGLAAIELCKLAGAEVIGTASASKHEFLRTRGVRHLIDYRTQDFEKETLRLTGGRGVQIILDAIGGDSWAKGLRTLSHTGRLVVFGFSSMAAGKTRNPVAALRRFLQVPWLKMNPISLMNGNKAVIGVNMGHLWHEQPMVHRWMSQLLRWAAEGKIRPRVDREFRFADAPAAHHHLQDRKNVGKVVLIP